jgi:hypothetical protein
MMAQIVFDTAADRAHIAVGISPKRTVALCGVLADTYGARIMPFDREHWPELDRDWCAICLQKFDPARPAVNL